MAREFLPIMALKRMLHIPAKIPYSVQLDVTTVCNLQCKMCPIHHVNQTHQHIDYQVFKRIIDKLVGVADISLVGLGEPFTNPQICEAIKYCKSKGLVVKTTTNGFLLNTQEKIKKIIESGIDSISFSLDIISNKNSEDAHPVQEVLDNIDLLIEIKKKLSSQTPEIIIQSVLQKNREQDIYDIVKWASSRGIHRVNILRMHMYFDNGISRPTRKEEMSFYKNISKLRRENNIRLDSLQDQFDIGIKGWLYKYLKYFLRLDSCCIRLLDYPFIDQQGNIIPCCVLPDYQFGNIIDSSLEEVWHGKKINNFRKKHQHTQICSRCDNWRIKYVV